MPFNDHPQYFRDILTCVGNIRNFRIGMTVEQVRADRKTEAAVERELQIIAEAAARLGKAAPTLCPEADWEGIRGLGNYLRHAYDRLDAQILEKILDEELAVLEPQVTAALQRITNASTNAS